MTARQRSGRKQHASAGDRDSNSEKANHKNHRSRYTNGFPKINILTSDTAFNRAVLSFFPWGNRLAALAKFYPGLARDTIRNWRRGITNPPDWAVTKLEHAMRSRALDYMPAAMSLATSPRGPGSGRRKNIPHPNFHNKRATLSDGPELSTI